MNIHKKAFIFTHRVFDKRFLSIYNKLLENLNKEYCVLLEIQNAQFREAITFAYKNVPFYHKLFTQLQAQPEDFKTVKDLRHLPILTKRDINGNFNDFVPLNLLEQKYFNNSSSGSTGRPFKYRFSKYDRLLSGCLAYRGWSYAGYELGDPMLFLSGAAMGMNYKNIIIRRFHEILRNTRKSSSYAMDKKNFNQSVEIINNFRPKFFRGLPSNIFMLARWIERENIFIHKPQAIITTSEKLFPFMKEKIENIFNAHVYDGYGLNDGGISAYEHLRYSGMRIDTERSVLEVVDNDGRVLTNGTGRILATSLHNTAMPFIRYFTGDKGTIKQERDGTNVIVEILGRQQELLKTPEGEIIQSNIVSDISKSLNSDTQFQVIQIDLNNIIVKLVPGENFNKSQLSFLKNTIQEYSTSWQIHFKFVDRIEMTDAGKYQYVINLMSEEEL